MPKQKQFSISLCDQDRRKIERLAKEDGLNRTSYIKRLIAHHLRDRKGVAA